MVAVRRLTGPVLAMVVLASGLAAAPLILTARPAAAECMGAFTPMPRFTDVARDARRIVVGMVEGELDPATGEPLYQPEPGVAAQFRLQVGRVLRGTAPRRMDIPGLRTHAPITGSCPQAPLVYVTPGDVVAIAFLGRMPGVRHRVTSAAWIAGRPDEQLVPRAQRLSLADAERVAREPGRTSSPPAEISSCPVAGPSAGPLDVSASALPSAVASPPQVSSSPSPDDPAAEVLARVALSSYLWDLRVGQYRSAWGRLSPQGRRQWDDFQAFRQGVVKRDSRIARMVDDRAAICAELAATDIRSLDISQAWLATVTDRPIADRDLDALWLVAPGRGGYPVLTQLREAAPPA